MGRVSKKLQAQGLRYIPSLLKDRYPGQIPTAATVYPPPETAAGNAANYQLFWTVENPDKTSFTLQIQINPKKIVKRYKMFKFNKYLNEFGFCDETGAEYLVRCIIRDDEKDIWGTVVTISDSLDPLRDINEFYHWLNDSFSTK